MPIVAGNHRGIALRDADRCVRGYDMATAACCCSISCGRWSEAGPRARRRRQRRVGRRHDRAGPAQGVA